MSKKIAAILLGIFAASFIAPLVVLANNAFIVVQGGTGTTTVTANQVILGNGTSPFKTVSVGSNGNYLVYLNGVPTWSVASSTNSVTSVTGVYPIISSGGTTPAISTAFGTTTKNVFSLLNTFANASSTLFTCTTCWVGTLGAAMNGGGFLINNIAAPVSGGDATNKTYVDNAITGVNPAVAVQAATTQASDTSSFTYINGVGGIGATFTGSVNTAVTIDGFTFTTLGQRLLVKNDTQSPSGAFNGVYYVTQVQTGILAPILTRALDYDMPSDINNTGSIPVVNGTINGSTSWILTSQVTTVGTDPLTYIKFSLNPSMIFTTAGTGLTGTEGNTVALTSYIATTTLETAGQIAVWGSTSGVPAKLYSVATSTETRSVAFSSTGTMGSNVGGTSGTLSSVTQPSFTWYATSTSLTGTTTISLQAKTILAQSFSQEVCLAYNGGVGTFLNVQLGNGTASTSMLQASSTANTNIISFTPGSGSHIQVDIGTSTVITVIPPLYVNCTFKDTI